MIDSIEEASDWYGQLGEERRNPKNDLSSIMLQEDRMHMQKEKLKWIKKGDVNSKFFHPCLNDRKRGRAITKIEEEDGSMITEDQLIARKITSYFEAMYSKELTKIWSLEGLDWHPIQ